MQNEIDSMQEVDYKIDVPTAPPTMLLLPEHCLLEIFEFLELEDSVNLAVSCNRLRSMANHIFKKPLQLDSKTLSKGEQYIDYMFGFIGQHVPSLKLDFIAKHLNLNKILGKISNDCKNLESLSIVNWIEAFESIPPPYSFDNVQLLTLENCNFDFAKSFLESFNKLKSLNILNCSIQPKELRMVLQHNAKIETFLFWSGHRRRFDFNCQLLELIPNVERFSLGGKGIRNILKLNSLPLLNRLTKLRLDCKGSNINNFLRQLAINGIMEEVDIFDVETDNDFFDILSSPSFEHLRLLVITRRYKRFKPSLAWPPQLKQLRLVNFVLTHNDLIAIICQLQSLESIDLRFCFVAEGYKSHFKDVKKLSLQILDVFDNGKRKQRLDVVLPDTEFSFGDGEDASDSKMGDESNLHRFQSKQLRILHPGLHPIYGVNQLGIGMDFPVINLY